MAHLIENISLEEYFKWQIFFAKKHRLESGIKEPEEMSEEDIRKAFGAE